MPAYIISYIMNRGKLDKNISRCPRSINLLLKKKIPSFLALEYKEGTEQKQRQVSY